MAFTLSGILSASDSFTTAYLGTAYPAVASAVQTPVYALCVLYLAVYSIRVYGGQVSGSPWEMFRRVLLVFLIFSSLHWSGLAQQIYNFFVGLMNGVTSAITGGTATMTTADAMYTNFLATASQMLQAGWTAIGIVLLGFLVYIVNCCFYVIGIYYMFQAKLGLAIVMSLLPLFLAALLFDATRQWFFNWAGKMVNFVLLFILVNAIIKFGFTAIVTAVDAAAGVTGSLNAGGSLLGAAATDVGAATELILVEAMLFLLMFQASKWASSLGGGAAAGGGAGLALVTKLLSKGLKG